jgi:hypothetical protein
MAQLSLPQCGAAGVVSRPARARRRRASSCSAAARAEEPDSQALLELDVVATPAGLAAVTRVTEGAAELVALREEEAGGLWVEAEEACFVLPLASLKRVPALYSQRSVADRVSNPHGEHAEGTWELLRDTS